MENRGFSKVQILLLVLPWVLLASTYFIFDTLAKMLDLKLAYFIGFIFYWVFWCYLVPVCVLGINTFKNVFQRVVHPFGKPYWIGILLLTLPPLLAFSTVFIKKLPDANLIIILGSLAIAVINATGEEILWRGVYIEEFPNNIFWGYLYPSIGFALWHISPQIVVESKMPGGVYAFVLGALFLGLCWGWVAYKTKSIRWSVYSHIITDFLGLGATIYFLTS